MIKKSEDIATERMMLISPLLADDLDPAKLVALKKITAEKSNISYRTIGRYLDAFKESGFSGLMPKSSANDNFRGTLPDNWSQIVDEAVILRRELPSRSVPQIITILELEGYAKPGEIKRSTLQRHILDKGYGARQVKLYSSKGLASRRFQKPHRGMLYQADIKYGPYLSIGKDGEKKQVYLSAMIDDCTRFIVHAKFYDNQRVEIIEDSMRSAIMRYGKPDALYVDNGKQYTSDWLKKSCAKLGIRLLHARAFHPEGKGKVEIFNKQLDSFLAEAALTQPKTLDQLNQMLEVWISEYYHKKPHTSLGDISPEIAFKADLRAMTFVGVDTLKEAFLHTKERRVDKTGCISFDGKKYEVGMDLIGRKVEICYDPQWTDEIEIHHKDKVPYRVKELVIGRNCGVETEVPEYLTPNAPKGSRLLEGLNKANITNRVRKSNAVSYRSLGGGMR